MKSIIMFFQTKTSMRLAAVAVTRQVLINKSVGKVQVETNLLNNQLDKEIPHNLNILNSLKRERINNQILIIKDAKHI